MKKIYLFLTVLLISNFSFSQTATEPASGAGNESDPYEIQSLENLYWLSQNSAYWDAYFIQTADIDASATAGWTSGSGDGFPPIGNDTNPFTGSYNGDNYVISNLYINRPSDYVGLFGYVGDYTLGGSLKKIRLVNATVIAPSGGDWWWSGLLVGYVEWTEIDSCHVAGTLEAEYLIGGLCGQIESCTVANSSADCTVTGIEDIGGFTGTTSGSVISNCRATGDVSGTSWIGGFSSYIPDEIYNCYATGNVTGTNMLGGFVGEVRHSSGSTPIIRNCYAWGNVTSPTASADGDIAAFAGQCDDNGNSAVEISYSYAIGSVIYESESNPTDKGFVGSEVGTHTYNGNFFNSSTSGQTSGTGATQQITSGMQTGSTFTTAGWDFMGETANGTDDIWGINQNENNGYPFLKWQGYKLRPEVNQWPNVSVIECSESLVAAELTDGSASVAGIFSFVEPDQVPPLGTSQQQLQFVPDDTETYENIFQQSEVNVEDTQAPIPVINNLPAVTAECEISVLSAPAATDACNGEVVGTHDISLPITTQGTYTVTWTYDDGNGNIAEQEQTILVEDVSLPVVVCPADQSIDLESGQSVYTVSGTEFDPTEITDNCEVAGVENDFNSTETLAGAEFPEGITTVVWTALDAAGNTQTCSFDVTVNAFVGISNFENSFEIYPNPTNGKVSLNFSKFSNFGKLSIELSNITGKIIHEYDNLTDREFQIDLSAQPAGVYFLKISTEMSGETKKIIKK